MTAHWIEQLNESQRQAVTFGEGPLLVVAGAGTGKTRTLVCRVAHLIESGIAPDRILMLTFTRRAAAEMLRRVEHLVRQSVQGKVWGGTFHAVANRLLRVYGRAVGLPSDFTVMDQADAADMMNLIRNESGAGRGPRRFPRKETLVAIYSRTVNAQEPLDDVLRRHFPWCFDDIEAIRRIFAAYTSRKREANVLDYDDLLLLWSAACSADGFGRMMADRFEHILVDEYQDTNRVQSDILRGMRQSRRNIMVVGDDAQSIYSFRAATVRNILDFPDHFPGAAVIKLEDNYRSTRPILALSNAVIARSTERYEKILRTDRRGGSRPVLWTCLDEPQQSDLVCRNILEHLERGVALLKQAVLFRAGHHSDHLEVELSRRNIPFHKYGGLKFVEAAHIKDMLAFLRILENPFDELSWFRILLLLEGIGPARARQIMTALAVRRVTPVAVATESDRTAGISPLRRLLDAPPLVPRGAEREFQGLREALGDCGGGRISGGWPDAEEEREDSIPLVAQIERLRLFYEPLLNRKYEHAAARIRDLDQLEQIAAGYRSRARLISDLTLDPPTSTSDLAGPPFLEEDYLILSTIHSAKGCEWDVVHILHAADGMIPSDMAVQDQAGVEEERRLFYVAMTRARNMLYIYFPLKYYHARRRFGDAHSVAQLTRFLPEDLGGLCEQRSLAGLEGDAVASSASRHMPTRVSRRAARTARPARRVETPPSRTGHCAL